MKKRLFSLCAVCAIVALSVMVSCEKPLMGVESDEPEGNLKVTVFEIEKTPFGSLTRGAEPASAMCKRLNFAIYTLDGTRVKQVNQTSDAAEFGTASFQLEEGDYQVVVVGHSSNGNPTMTDPSCIKFTNAQGYTDTYLCSGVVTIGAEPMDFQVSLDRIVALCRFVITDDFPADVKQMRFYYTGGSGAFDANTGLGCVNSKQDVKFSVTTGQKQFDLYTFLHDVEGTIHLTVTGLDAAGNELYNRQFDVPMQQNYITWLTGAFFNGSGSSSTTIGGVTVNTDWAGETHITF
jgi:hypothetical protein